MVETLARFGHPLRFNARELRICFVKVTIRTLWISVDFFSSPAHGAAGTLFFHEGYCSRVKHTARLTH
jgi:hypothetical protein